MKKEGKRLKENKEGHMGGIGGTKEMGEIL